MSNTKTKTKTPDRTVNDLAAWLNGRSDGLAKWTHQDGVRRLVAIASMAAKAEGKILRSDWTTLYLSLITAARWGMEPATAAGVPADCYLVPRWDKERKTHAIGLMPSYRGLIKLVLQSGSVTLIRSHVVYAKDELEIHQGSGPRIDHRVYLGADRGDPTGAYAIATMADGDQEYEWVPWADIEKIRAQAANSPAWRTWPDQMARKAAIKRICNQLPMAPLAREAIAADHAVSEGRGWEAVEVAIDQDGQETPVEVEVRKPTTRKDSLKDRLRRRAEAGDDFPEPETCDCGAVLVTSKGGMVLCPNCDEEPKEAL